MEGMKNSGCEIGGKDQWQLFVSYSFNSNLLQFDCSLISYYFDSFSFRFSIKRSGGEISIVLII